MPNYNNLELYYENNMNSLFYGKLPDFFVLDVWYSEDTYNAALDKAVINNISERPLGNYIIYITDKQKHGAGGICFNEATLTLTVRYMYIQNYKL